MKTLFLMLFLLPCTLLASEEYSVEKRFNNPVKLPAHIVSYLTKEVQPGRISSCEEAKNNEMFEAEVVHLNASAKAYLVKPAHMCVCTTHYCPMWMFSMKSKTAKPIWTHPATHTLEILDKKLSGYRKLKEMGEEPTRGHDSVWSWERDRYTEIDNTEWTLDTEKECRLTKQTSQMMDGTMVQHFIKCAQH